MDCHLCDGDGFGEHGGNCPRCQGSGEAPADCPCSECENARERAWEGSREGGLTRSERESVTRDAQIAAQRLK